MDTRDNDNDMLNEILQDDDSDESEEEVRGTLESELFASLEPVEELYQTQPKGYRDRKEALYVPNQRKKEAADSNFSTSRINSYTGTFSGYSDHKEMKFEESRKDKLNTIIEADLNEFDVGPQSLEQLEDTHYNEEVTSHRKSLFQSIITKNKKNIEETQAVLDGISDSSEDWSENEEKSKSLRNKSELNKIKKIGDKEKRFRENIKRMTLLDVIENHEKQESKGIADLEKEFKIFGQSSELEIPQSERKRMEYKPLSKISQYLYSKAGENDGLPHCVRQHGDNIFIGMSHGIIRIFDIKTNEEHKSLVPKKNKNFSNKVTWMDVTVSGNQLIAGYQSGKICMFDVTKQKVIVEVDNVFTNQVEHIRFLSNLSVFNVITCDKRGYVTKLTITKSLLKFSWKAERVADRPVQDVCSISALQPRAGMPAEVVEWCPFNIVAVASTDNIYLYICSNPMRAMYGLSRSDFGKDFIKPESMWYLDWGYGITPTIMRDSSKWLLAIAWDKILQICILLDPEDGMSSLKLDGFYVSDYPIDSVLFLSDSVVMILVNQKELRVLFIPSFMPGSFAEEGIRIKENEDKKTQVSDKSRTSIYHISLGEDLIRDFSLKAEVEKGSKLLNGNIKHSTTSNKQNFNTSITSYENNLLILGKDEILLASLYYWEDYLQYIQHKWGWLVCLRAALDIYNGELKGYYGVPYIVFEREEELMTKLEDLVHEGIIGMIKYFHGNRNSTDALTNYENDNDAIKVAIEFCREIKSFQFLFGNIFGEFKKEGFEDKFVENLEPFILSGFFKEEIIPDDVLEKITYYYFENNKFQILERVISCLDFSKYQLLDELEAVWQMKKLTTTMIHLIITSNQSDNDYSWKKILDEIITWFQTVKFHVTLDEIKCMPEKEKEDAYKIASSYEYIGLKLMYVFKMYISGDKFPDGKMHKEMHQKYLAQWIEFLFVNDHILELIQVNARSFFNTVSELYINKYVANTIVQLNNSKNDDGRPVLKTTHPLITDRLAEITEKLKTVKYMKFEFCYFIIKVANSDFYRFNQESLLPRMYDSIYTVLKALIDFEKQKIEDLDISKKEENQHIGPNYINLNELEDDILEILPFYVPFFEPERLDSIIKCATSLEIDKISIYIYEERLEFEKCMHAYLNSPGWNPIDIFPWLRTLHKKRNKLQEESVERIKVEILRLIKDLVSADSNKTRDVIDTWLPDQQLEVVKSLEQHTDLQLTYLQSFLNEREEEIRKVILSASKSPETVKASREYKQLLFLHVKLLVQKESSDLKEVVMKDYYPIETMDNIEDSSIMIKEAKAYLKKRSEMFSESLTLFLKLMQQVPYDNIEIEFLKGKTFKKTRKGLSFNKLFDEVWDILIKSMGRPDSSDSLWFEALKVLFSITNQHTNSKKEKKIKSIQKGFYNKISEFLQIMSKYVEFEKVCDVLLKIDPNAVYSYANQWFKNIFIAKNDQEFLYRAAKQLLRNENSVLIQSIIHQSEGGFKGDVFFSNCALCKQTLGLIYDKSALVLSMCNHNFHSKCYYEEITNLKTQETRNKIDSKPGCPICRKTSVLFDENRRRNKGGARRRRNKNQKDSDNKSSEDNDTGNDISNNSEIQNPLGQLDEEELKRRDEMMIKHKLAAFDEDYAASMPMIPYV